MKSQSLTFGNNRNQNSTDDSLDPDQNYNRMIKVVRQSNRRIVISTITVITFILITLVTLVLLAIKDRNLQKTPSQYGKFNLITSLLLLSFLGGIIPIYILSRTACFRQCLTNTRGLFKPREKKPPHDEETPLMLPEENLLQM